MEAEQSFDARYSVCARQALDELPDSFTVSDPWAPGHPIVYASRGFLKMSGYPEDEVVGKNGRIFQGPSTDRRSVLEIRWAILEEATVQTKLLNYRKDGTPFWMLFHMSPLFCCQDGRVTNFVAVQVPLRSRRGICSVSPTGFASRLGLDNGSCRRQLSAVGFGPALSPDFVSDSINGAKGGEEPCEANDLEKQEAATIINNVISILTDYSKSTGKLVSRKRCSLPGTRQLSSSFLISLGRIKQSFVLADPHSQDMPIVYASDAFLSLTGYSRHEVLERNFKFLSGVGTDPSALQQINESIQNERPCTVRILNYRKDQSSFWNLLHMSPVRNASGKVTADTEGSHTTGAGARCPQPLHVIAYVVGVHIKEGCDNLNERGLSIQMRQFSVVGAVRVAVRSLSMGAGTSME